MPDAPLTAAAPSAGATLTAPPPQKGTASPPAQTSREKPQTEKTQAAPDKSAETGAEDLDLNNPFDAAEKDFAEKTRKAKPDATDDKDKEDKGDKDATDKAAEDKSKDKTEATPKDDKRRIEPKELRAQLDKTSGELKTKSDQVAALEKKIADYEKSGKDTEALSTKLAEREKELDEMRGKLSASEFQASEEYAKNFKKPFDKAAGYAKKVIEQLATAEFENPADGSLVPSRPAKWDDFVALYRMPMSEAVTQARKLFGDSSQLVINQLTELQRLDYQSQEAMAEEKAGWEGKQKTRTAEAARHKEAISKMWVTANEALAEKYAVKPEEVEIAALQAEGYKITDSVHNREALTMQQRVVLDANIRHRAANYSVEKFRRESAEKERDDWKAKYEELKGSGPGKTIHQGDGGTAPSTDKGDREELGTFLPRHTT